MNFKLNVNITEEDYLDFNVFWFLRSPYGKKQKKKMNLMLIILSVCFSLLTFVTNYKQHDSLTVAIVASLIIFAALMLAVLLYPKSYKKQVKMSLKSQKKAGKLAYSPTSVLEFYDDYYVETEPDSTTQKNYTVIERISYIDGKAIYIHTGSVSALLLPVRCFASEEELNSFLQFICSKCPNFDMYQK